MRQNFKVTELIVNEFVKKLDIFSKNGELQKLYVFYLIHVFEIFQMNLG